MPKYNNKPQREMNRRQLSHHQRESMIQRYALLGGMIVIIAVILVVGTGIYMNRYKPYQEAAVKVGNTEYDVSYFIDASFYYATLFGGNSSNVGQYINQLASQYQTSQFTQQVAQIIEQNKLLVDEAAKLGITVSDADINKYITDNKVTPVSQAVKDVVHSQLIVNKLKSDYFDKQVPASGPQRDILAMFLESQAQVDQMKAQLEGGADFGQLTQNYSLEASSQSKKGEFGLVPQGVLPSSLNSTVLENAAFDSNAQTNTLYTVVDPNQTKNEGYWLLKVTETTTNSTDNTRQLHVFGMLLSSEEQAQDIKAQLDNGADFATLAKANSQYTAAQDGDMSFISKGTLGNAVDAVLFPGDASKTVPMNQVLDPIKDTSRSTTGGIWLYKVTNIQDNATIDGNNRTTLVNNKLNDWYDKIWTDNQSNVQYLLSPSQENFVLQQVVNR